MRYISFAILLSLAASCGNETKPVATDSVPATAVSATTLSEVQPLRPNISLMPWEGDLADAIYWRDARGENAVVISQRPQYFWAKTNPKAKSFFPKGQDEDTFSELAEIFATHFVLKRGQKEWQVFNTYHDFLFGCCDVFMDYQPGSLQVTDVDANGIGEPLFMYNATEGDGILSGYFTGAMVYESDSTYYSMQGNTGLGFEIDVLNKKKAHDNAWKTDKPKDEMQLVFLNNKWRELYLAKVQQDREGLFEKDNAGEHGHNH